MRIEIQFSDGHKELFENATHAAKAMGITTPTVLSAKKLGKKRISRRRDKQEFQIHCENFPRIVISDRENEFSFPTLKEAEEFFDFPKILSSKVRFNHDMVVDMKNKIQRGHSAQRKAFSQGSKGATARKLAAHS